jgi:hypothetical protein
MKFILFSSCKFVRVNPWETYHYIHDHLIIGFKLSGFVELDELIILV